MTCLCVVRKFASTPVEDLNGFRVAQRRGGADDDNDHNNRCTDELCTKLAELAQRIDDDLAKASGGAAIDYGALEQRVADALGEVERGLHAQVLARLDIDVPAIRVWGDEYRRIGRAESDYHTLAGTVRVMRTVYRKTERNGDTLDPVSVRAGVVADGWLPHTARAVAYLLAQGTSREAEASWRELARAAVLAIELRARRSRGGYAVPASAGAERGGANPGVRGAGRGAQREHLDRPRRAADGGTDRGAAGAGGSAVGRRGDGRRATAFARSSGGARRAGPGRRAQGRAQLPHGVRRDG